MKVFLTFIMVVMSALLLVEAQNYSISSYTGDDGDYWSGAYVYKFIYLNGSLSDQQNLPFAFNFYGQPVNSYRISENGYISFDAASGASINANTALPNIGGPNNAIYALWDNFTSAVTISTKTYGIAPHRVHQITWAGLNYPGAASWQDDLTVSINLYENCHDFEVVVIDNSIATTSPFYAMINTTIGCENSSGTVGAQVVGSPNYIPSNPGWNKALYEVHRFSWNTPIVNDASLVSISIDHHLAVGNHTLTGHVRNEGDATLSSYDINYTLNGGAVQTSSVNNVSATNAQLHQWTHIQPINIPSANTSYELKVWVDNVNGALDGRSCNDTLVEYITGINNTPSPKKVLLEEFTGTWCGHCIDGAVYIDNLKAQHGANLIPVAVHDSDSMEFAEGLRVAFSASGYPTALVDRHRDGAGTQYAREPLGRGSWGSNVAARLSGFTPVEVDITNAWNPVTRLVDITVTVDYSDHSAGDARIVVMVVEDSLTGVGRGWDQGNYYNTRVGHPYYGAGSSVVGFVHRHVLRDYVGSGPFGTRGVIPLFVSAGSRYQQQFQYALPAGYRPEHITLVAAVVNYLPTNDPMYIGVRGQREVLNVDESPLQLATSTITLQDEAPNLRVYPNPTMDQVAIELQNYQGEHQIEVYNTAGQRLVTTTQNTVDLRTYPEGVYLLSVRYENEVKQVRVIKINP